MVFAIGCRWVCLQPKELAKFAEGFRGSGSNGIISAFERETGYTSPALHCETIPSDVGGGPEGLVSHFQDPVLRRLIMKTSGSVPFRQPDRHQYPGITLILPWNSSQMLRPGQLGPTVAWRRTDNTCINDLITCRADVGCSSLQLSSGLVVYTRRFTTSDDIASSKSIFASEPGTATEMFSFEMRSRDSKKSFSAVVWPNPQTQTTRITIGCRD